MIELLADIPAFVEDRRPADRWVPGFNNPDGFTAGVHFGRWDDLVSCHGADRTFAEMAIPLYRGGDAGGRNGIPN